MKLLTLLLLASCANESTYYRMTTTSLKCPHDYIYNTRDQLCHYSKPPAPQFDVKPINLIKAKHKSVKRFNEPIDCVKAINFCGFDKK